MDTRRIFLKSSGLLAAGALTAPSLFAASKAMNIQQVIDILLQDISGAPFKQTVDTIKSGDVNQEVTVL